MSVDRQYTIRVSSVAENSQGQQTGQDFKVAGTAKQNAGDDMEVFETNGRELRELIRELNDVLSETGVLLRTIFGPTSPGITDILSAGIKAVGSGEPSTTDPTGVKLPEQEPTAANGSVLTPVLNSSGREYIGSEITNARATVTPSEHIDGQTHSELMDQSRKLQKTFQTQGPVVSQHDAVELLSVIHQLGQAFFEHGQNSVTKQQFHQELAALRRLIESKGK